MSTSYSCRFIADKRSVSLVEVAASESERTVTVSVTPTASWEIVLPIWYPPSVAVLGGAGAIAVWSVARLFLLWEGRSPVRVDFDDEIHAVYAMSGVLCVVGELSIFVYDPGREAIVDRWQANDALGASWWEGDKLLVESSAGTCLAFRPTFVGVGYLGL